MNKSIIIAYDSMTGNTEEMACILEDLILTYNNIHNTNYQVTRKVVSTMQAYELLDYDMILLGAYTWGNGELPKKFIKFYEEMNHLDLIGKDSATFGSGDTSYKTFCYAVNILEDKLRNLNSNIKVNNLKIELFPNQRTIHLFEKFINDFLIK